MTLRMNIMLFIIKKNNCFVFRYLQTFEQPALNIWDVRILHIPNWTESLNGITHPSTSLIISSKTSFSSAKSSFLFLKSSDFSKWKIWKSGMLSFDFWELWVIFWASVFRKFSQKITLFFFYQEFQDIFKLIVLLIVLSKTEAVTLRKTPAIESQANICI